MGNTMLMTAMMRARARGKVYSRMVSLEFLRLMSQFFQMRTLSYRMKDIAIIKISKLGDNH